MRHALLAIIMNALAAGGMSLAQHGEHGKGGAQVKLLSQKDIIEKLDGKKAKATSDGPQRQGVSSVACALARWSAAEVE